MIRPEADELVQITLSWVRVLAPIPDDWLAEAFVRALQSHDREGVIAPGRVIAAWDAIRAENARRHVEAEGRKYLDAAQPPRSDGARFFAAGLEAARRLRGIPMPAGTPPSDEADVQAALRAINASLDHRQRQKYEAMRQAPPDVRAGYPTPGPDTLDRLRATRRRGGEFRAAVDTGEPQ